MKLHRNQLIGLKFHELEWIAKKITAFCDWPSNSQNWHGLQLNSWIGSKMLWSRCERSCFCVRSAIHTIFMQCFQLTCNPFKNCNPDTIQVDCVNWGLASHDCGRNVQLCRADDMQFSQNCEVLCNCLRITWLVVKFANLNGLRKDWRIVQGFLGTAQSFINPRDCRRLDLHCNGCSWMRSNRRSIIRAAWNLVLIFGSGFNWRAICLNCNRIVNIWNCNAIGWIAKDEIIDCIRIVTTQESAYFGLWAPERIAKDTRHLSGPALESGLRHDGQPLG